MRSKGQAYYQGQNVCGREYIQAVSMLGEMYARPM